MHLVDSHCHLNFDDFEGDVDGVIARAKTQGISTLLTICTHLDEATALQEIATAHPSIFCTVGVHPHEAEEILAEMNLARMKARLLIETEHPRVVGLGEAGLDYYYEHSPREAQQQVFQTHLDVALETGLPLSIHTRDAEEDTIRMIQAAKGVRGVIHCFTGSQWLADQALALGFYISISGVVTFKKSEALRDVVKTIPLDRLLVETDAPYLAPIPHRGKRNEPALMIHTAQMVAELKGVTLDEIATVTTQNFFKLFSKAT